MKLNRITDRCPAIPKRLAGSLVLIGMSAALSLHASVAGAATYYVDPAAGNDGNAGTSQSAPWKTVPGTRTASDGGWMRSAWGSVSPSSPLQPGDIVEIKAGSQFNSGNTGRILVDSNFYANGTSTAPITVRVSSTWGSGPVVYDFSGVSVPAYMGNVSVGFRNYIQLMGSSTTNRLVLKNGGAKWQVAFYGSYSAHSAGDALSYAELANAATGGFNSSYSDRWTVSHTLSHDHGEIGFAVGGINDENSDGGSFVDDEAWGNGANGSGSGIQHGFGMYGSTNITYVGCKSHNNLRRGFDFGTTSNSNASSATVVDSTANDNGEAGFGTNGGSSGQNVTTYVNDIAFNNAEAGWDIYGGATAYLYQVIAHSNGSQSSFGGNFMIYSEGSFVTKATIKNSIGYKPKAYANVYSYNTQGATTYITSSNNIFVPRSSDSEVFAETPYGSAFTYTNLPSWVSSSDKIGLKYDPGFTAISTTSFAANDYHIKASTSPAINGGTSLSGVAYTDKDFDNVARVGAPDIGAYEYATGTQMVPPANLRLAQ